LANRAKPKLVPFAKVEKRGEEREEKRVLSPQRQELICETQSLLFFVVNKEPTACPCWEVCTKA
jgi:hypothetical protein